MQVGFRIVKRFDARCGQAWTSYIDWSKLSGLQEVVGLDCMLCASTIRELTDEDWSHAVLTEHLSGVFDDHEYLLRRLGAREDLDRLQLLAVAREPTEADIDSWHLAGFQFKGFDLIEEWSEVSALTNCGGFEAAFRSADLSPCGLIPRAARAYEIRDALNIHYPDEEHADCGAWAVWRFEERLTHR